MDRHAGRRIPVRLGNSRTKPDATGKTMISKGKQRKGTAYDMDVIKQKINWLVSHGDTKVDDLEGEPKKVFKEVNDVIDSIKDTQEYTTIMKYSKGVFGNPESLRPGTVTSHFIGCYYGSGSAQNPLCSPSCAGSLQPPSNLGWGSCQRNVAMYDSEGGLRITYSKPKSREMDVYLVGTDEFEGFTDEEVQEIKKSGTNKVSLKKFDASNPATTTLVQDSTSVDDLCEKTIKRKSNTSLCIDDESLEEDNGYSFGIVLVVILLVVILVIAACCYGGWYSSESGDTQYSDTMTTTSEVSNNSADFLQGPSRVFVV